LSSASKQLRVLNALADESRLRIIQTILSGTSNPGEIARSMGKHKSTIEKHLRILLETGVIQKTPRLDDEGHLQVRYTMNRERETVIRNILDMAERLSETKGLGR
jgi:predicted transcriptional regulator